MASVEFLVKLRDAAQLMADAANEYLERLAPKDEKHNWDPNKIPWKEAQGTRGLYDRSEEVDNLQFKAMVKDLAAHKGKLSRDGYFYWLFQSGSVVGRKKRS